MLREKGGPARGQVLSCFFGVIPGVGQEQFDGHGHHRPAHGVVLAPLLHQDLVDHKVVLSSGGGGDGEDGFGVDELFGVLFPQGGVDGDLLAAVVFQGELPFVGAQEGLFH